MAIKFESTINEAMYAVRRGSLAMPERLRRLHRWNPDRKRLEVLVPSETGIHWGPSMWEEFDEQPSEKWAIIHDPMPYFDQVDLSVHPLAEFADFWFDRHNYEDLHLCIVPRKIDDDGVVRLDWSELCNEIPEAELEHLAGKELGERIGMDADDILTMSAIQEFATCLKKFGPVKTEKLLKTLH